MISAFDFDVIQRSWVYLFREGMSFTLTLTALAMAGGIEKYFHGAISDLERAGRLSDGCLMTNTMTEVGGSDRRIHKRTRAHFDRVGRMFAQAARHDFFVIAAFACYCCNRQEPSPRPSR